MLLVSQKKRQLIKSNQSFQQQNILGAICGQKLLIFKKFAKYLDVLQFIFTFIWLHHKLSTPKISTPVLISLVLLAEIGNFVNFLRKILIFSRNTTYFDQFLKNLNMICVWNYRSYVVQKLTFEKNHKNAKISSACPKKCRHIQCLLGGRRRPFIASASFNLPKKRTASGSRLRLPIPDHIVTESYKISILYQLQRLPCPSSI